MTAVTARPNIKFIKYEDYRPVIEVINVILYARHSTDHQGGSCDDQLRLMHNAVEAGEMVSILFPGAKLNIIYEFKDEAVSGFGTVGRDGLDKAQSLLQRGEAHVIIVSDFKRFLRGMGIALTLYDQLQDYSAELLAVSDGFSSSEKGARLKFMGKAYASEEFLESVSNDTQRGLNVRRKQGYSDGHLWLGVSSKKTKEILVKGRMKDSHFDYFVIPHLAALVLRIFGYARDGYSTKEIAKTLCAEKVPPPSCYDKEGNPQIRPGKKNIWRDRSVWQILNNKAYIGVLERNKTKIVKRGDGTRQAIKIPPHQWLVMEREDLRIVPQELWNQVRERMKVYQRKKVSTGAEGKPFRYDGTTNHILTGICKCAECGGSFIIATGRRGGYYGCQKNYRLGGCKNNKLISWKKLELPIISWIIEQLKNEEIYKFLAKKYNELRSARVHGDAGELEKKELRLIEIEIALGNIMQSLELCPGSPTILKRLGELENEQKSLTEKVKFIRGTDQSSIYITPSAIKQRFGEIPTLLLHSEPFKINRALKPLLGTKGIRLEKRQENEKEVYWAIGSLNLGKVMTLADQSGTFGNEGIAYEIALELQL